MGLCARRQVSFAFPSPFIDATAIFRIFFSDKPGATSYTRHDMRVCGVAYASIYLCELRRDAEWLETLEILLLKV